MTPSVDGGESRLTISRRFSTAVSWPDSLFVLGNPFASGSAFVFGNPFRAERPLPDGTVIAESLGSAEVARDCTAGTPVFEGKEFRSGRSLAAGRELAADRRIRTTGTTSPRRYVRGPPVHDPHGRSPHGRGPHIHCPHRRSPSANGPRSGAGLPKI